MGKGRSILAVNKTLLLWLPFPLLAVVGYWMLAVRDHHLYQSVEQFIYESKVDTLAYGCGNQFALVCRCERYRQSPLSMPELAKHDCPLIDRSFYAIKDHVSDIERDIHSAVERLKMTFRDDIIQRLDSELDNARDLIARHNGNIDTALFGRGNDYNRVNDSPIIAYSLADYHADLEPPSCNGVIDQVFKLRDCVKNIALEPLSNAYLDIRQDLRREAGHIAADGEQSLDEKINAIKEAVSMVVNQRLDNYGRSAHQSIEANFAALKTIDRISFVIWIVMVAYALFLGFLYVFIRYVYNQKYGQLPFVAAPSNTIYSVADPSPSPPILIQDITVDDRMNSFSQQVTQDRWYASIDSDLRYEVDGIISLPRPLTLLFKRFPNRYLLFRYDACEGKSMISAHANGLTRFIKIGLRENQSICFDFSTVVAFSDSLSLKTTLNLSLAAFFQNQLFFSTATGPGELIIRTKSGTPELMPMDGIKPSDPRDVVVFDLHGSYSLLADLNPLSVYFLGHRVVPDENTVLIRQSPDAKSSFSAQATAVRRTLYLLLPLTFVTIILPWILP
jgi:hypothetical protein